MVPYKHVSQAGFKPGTFGVPLLEFEVALLPTQPPRLVLNVVLCRVEIDEL